MSMIWIERADATYAGGAVGLRSYDTAAQFDDVRLNGRLVDDFADGNADDWKTFGGKWTVRDGQYTVEPARAGKALLNRPTDLRDFTFEATVTLPPGGNAGLIFRVSVPTAELDGYRGYYVGLACQGGESEDAEEPPVSPVTAECPRRRFS